MGKIDELDMKILSELVKNSSISVPKLSKKINVNASVVYSRVRRLVKRNLIKRFTIEVNEEQLGLNVTAIIGINIDSKLRDEIIVELLSLNDVREISSVTGRFDLIVTAKVKSLDELAETVPGKIGKINGVLHTETFIEMKKQKREPKYSLPKS